MTELRARAGEKDVGRKIKYFVQGDLQVSYGQFSSLKNTGGLRVNGEIVHANYILQYGDEICVRLPNPAASKQVAPEEGELKLVYEDDALFIIDKPAPLPCQCSPRQPSGTLENRVCAHFGEGFAFRPLNRLDKGTSGLMAAAKHPHACQILQKQLHTPNFLREYLAVAEGVLQGEGRIDLPIAKENAATVRRAVDFERGLPAATQYRAERTNGRYTLVRLRLETGRTHQIRVHLAAIGHPIAGDFLYGRELPDLLPGRFALHSTRIELLHPMNGQRILRESPLPIELENLLQ